MLRRFPLILLVLLAGGVAGYVVSSGGCRGGQDASPSPGRVKIARPVQSGNDVKLHEETVSVPANRDPVEAAVTALLETADDPSRPSAIPKGTRLIKLTVDGGLATLNLSPEFNALQKGGDAQESLAQNALRKALAQFPQIKMMLVRVDGKPFQSEHTDWNEPIPVRESSSVADGAP